MTMIAQLFVLACACALGSTQDVPPYVQYQQAIDDAVAIVSDNVLSIDGDVPQLDDARRHYTQIINLINEAGKQRSGCISVDYDEQYPSIANESLAQGLANPQDVINEINNLVEVLTNVTQEIVEIVQTTVKSGVEQADEAIAQAIQAREDLKDNAALYEAVGEAAKALLELDPIISEHSQNFTTTSLGVQDKEHIFKNVIDNTAQVHRVLQYWNREHPC